MQDLGINQNAIKIALLPLLLGVLHALAMLTLRIFPDAQHFLIYQKALSGHVFSLIMAWSSVLAVMFCANHRSQVDRLLYLFVVVSYLILLTTIWTADSFVYTRYALAPVKKIFLIAFAIFAFSLVLFSFKKLSELIFKGEDLKTFKTPLLIAVAVAACIQIRLLSPVLLTQELVGELESQRLKLMLGLAHLPIQFMSLIVVYLWTLIFKINLQGRLGLWFRFGAYFVPSFVIMVLFSELGLFPWKAIYIAVPTFYTIPSVLIIFFVVLKRLWDREGLSSLQWQAFFGFLLFSVWGGITGINIASDVLTRTMTLHSLLMPSHLHPLVAAGFTGSVLIYLTSNRKDLFWPRWGFLFGIALMSLGMRIAGKLQWPRRTMFANESSSQWPMLLLAFGGICALTCVLLIIYKVWFSSERESRSIRNV